jgi:hypothetical protein
LSEAISASVLVEFTLDRLYQIGDLFVQPEGYSQAKVVDLWVMGWIGDFDTRLLPPDLEELIAYPEWREIRLTQLKCPGCA